MADRPDYRRLVLDLENELKRSANLRNWSPSKRREMQAKVTKLRALLESPLESPPTKEGA